VKSRYLNKTLVEGSTTVTGSTANWWLLANPSILPVIEVAFLNGQEMPTVQQAGVRFPVQRARALHPRVLRHGRQLAELPRGREERRQLSDPAGGGGPGAMPGPAAPR
jgi:hypothetical protein